MPVFRYGGRNGTTQTLVFRDDLLAVRTHSRTPVLARRPFETAALGSTARAAIAGFDLVARFPEAGVDVLHVPGDRRVRARRDAAKRALRPHADVRFAGRVLSDDAGSFVLYTENLFVKFVADLTRAECLRLLKRYRLNVKRPLRYARNAYFVDRAEGIGTEVFDIAQELLRDPFVEACHPELVKQPRCREVFREQWHLQRTRIGKRIIDQHANVVRAWEFSKGRGVVIAIVDDGVDIDHEEFSSEGKLVAPRDVTRRSGDPRPGNEDHHGTACAGVACADGRFRASGVAPRARLMPIRLVSGLGSQAEADAFYWAARNGADVISCSWGPDDGDWEDPDDRRHKHREPLPDSTRYAIDYAVRHGRGGKGCVVVFAAGNGRESVDNDGYASYHKVIAVAACNDRGTRAAYSDFGNAVWCAFPSNHGRRSLTPGIWTTDRSGHVGYNEGISTLGDHIGDYTDDFGGTSSAAPGVAGVAALVLARNPKLTGDQVREILRLCCDRIDARRGKWDKSGRSPYYGFGRVNALKAVLLARLRNAVSATATRLPTRARQRMR